MNALVSDILERAADLIEPEGRWTQGLSARDATGRWVNAREPAATCWCAVGAMGKIAAPGSVPEDAYRVVLKTIRCRQDDYGRIAKWNDAPNRTQAEVVAKLREAAAKAREQGK